MESSDLLAYVKDGLRRVGPKRWPEIGAATGTSVNTMRKVAYNNRKNPRIQTIQPIANWLHENLQ